VSSLNFFVLGVGVCVLQRDVAYGIPAFGSSASGCSAIHGSTASRRPLKNTHPNPQNKEIEGFPRLRMRLGAVNIAGVVQGGSQVAFSGVWRVRSHGWRRARNPSTP
jgi:hypothetical protein